MGRTIYPPQQDLLNASLIQSGQTRIHQPEFLWNPRDDPRLRLPSIPTVTCHQALALKSCGVSGVNLGWIWWNPSPVDVTFSWHDKNSPQRFSVFPERLGEGRFLGAVSLSSLTWLAWFKLLNLNLLDLTCLTWTCWPKLSWLDFLDLTWVSYLLDLLKVLDLLNLLALLTLLNLTC